MAKNKKYTAARALVDSKKYYTIDEAVALAKQTSITKFDSSIDIAIKLNLDTTKAEQQLRGSIALPYYFGKQTRILVLSDTITKEQAAECGADFIGGKDRIDEIKNG
jgi:large subunit ribosomal protein L1